MGRDVGLVGRSTKQAKWSLVMKQRIFGRNRRYPFCGRGGGSIGLSAANLAIQVNKGRAAFDASTPSHMLSQLAYPQPRGRLDARGHEPAGQLNF
jgi:hypothetical protein